VVSPVLLCSAKAVVQFRSMAAKDTSLNELGDMLAHVVEHMATKDDLKSLATKDELKGLATKLDAFAAGVGQRFDDLHAEIRSVRSDLNDLSAKVENMIGYRKEI